MTQDLTSHLLRAYFSATNWDPTQSYLHLTSTSSSILLDFPIPAGLSLSISSCSSPSTFYSTHRLRALPHLAGSLGYVFARTERPLDLAWITSVNEEEGQRDDRLRHVLERFRIVNEPRAPSSTTPGTSSSTPRDYLLYGNIHAPTCRLDALYTTRLSPTWNLILTACSFPPRNPNHAYIPTENAAAGGQGRTAPGATNLQVTVQNDVGEGRWFNEWSYSVDDALWGFRTMHHFGHRGAPSTTTSANANEVDTTTEPATATSSSSSSVGGGLRGRFSAGGELFFSAAEKSAGLSTGVRFTTLPENDADGTPPSQPPTTITATLNPMMGHMSTAYAAQVARDVVCCSRYDFNVYSYESELTVGGEYWLRGSSSGTGRGAVVAQEEEVVGRGATTARSLVPAMKREASLRSDTGAGTSRPSSSSSSSSSLPQSALGLPNRELTSTTATRSHASLRDRDVDVEVEVEPPAPGTPTLPAPAPPSEEQHPPPLPVGTLPPAPAPQPPRLSPPPPVAVVNEPPPAPRGLLKTSFNLSTLLLSLLYQGSLSNGCIVRVGLRVDLLRGAGAGARGLDGLKAGSKGGAGGGGGGAAGILRGVGMEVVYLGGGGGGAKAEDAGEATLRQEGTTRQPPVVVVGSGQVGGGGEQAAGDRFEM